MLLFLATANLDAKRVAGYPNKGQALKSFFLAGWARAKDSAGAVASVK